MWIQERVRTKDLEVIKLNTDDNKADIGTKYLEGGRIEHLLRLMGLTTRSRTISLCRGVEVVGDSTTAVVRMVTSIACVRGVAGHQPSRVYEPDGAAKQEVGICVPGIFVPLSLLLVMLLHMLLATYGVSRLWYTRGILVPKSAGEDGQESSGGEVPERAAEKKASTPDTQGEGATTALVRTTSQGKPSRTGS